MSILKPAKPNGSMPIRPTRKPSAPAEPAPKVAGARMGRISSLGVADRLDNDGTKSPLDQITETKEEVMAVELEAKKLAQYLQRNPELEAKPITAGVSYVPYKGKDAPKLPPLPSKAPSAGHSTVRANNGSLPSLTYTDRNGDERAFNCSQRDELIWHAVVNHRRLTSWQIADYVAGIEGKDDVVKLHASIIRSNIYKADKSGTLKKISPSSGCPPFYIATEAGQLAWGETLPLEKELVDDDFRDDDIVRNAHLKAEHTRIMNIATAAIKFEIGQMRIKVPVVGTAQPVLHQAPMLPILTLNRITHSGETMGYNKKNVELQKLAVRTWLNLDASHGGLLRVDNATWKLGSTSVNIAKAIQATLLENFVVKEKTSVQTDNSLFIPPAWLFYTYDADGNPYPENLIHFALGQPNIALRDTSGKTNIWNGCQVGRVESLQLGLNACKAILYGIYHSPILPSRCYIVTNEPAIEYEFSQAWRGLVADGFVGKEYSDWLAFTDHDLINSTSQKLEPFTAPVPGKPARITSWG